MVTPFVALPGIPMLLSGVWVAAYMCVECIRTLFLGHEHVCM